MTQTFLKTVYKEHREKFLFDKEMAMMPATQIVIEHLRYQESLKKQLYDIQITIHYLTRRRDQIRHMIYINAPPPTEDDDNTLNQGRERRAFVRRCADPSCRGFLSTAWKCGICSRRTCHRCHVIKVEDEDHVCHPDNVETVNLLSNDSKTCPKCGVYIYKTDGCNQMWCTQCHIAFDWITGRIQTKVHNPHYYEWLRQQNTFGVERDPMDILCGRELNQGMLRYECIDYSKKYINQFFQILQVSMHIQNVVAPRFRVDPEVCCQTLRIRYLTNEITEDYFRVHVQRMYKKNEKKREISDILAVYIQSTTDILFRFVDRIHYYYKEASIYEDSEIDEELQGIINEVERLIDYCNECFIDIAKIYHGQALKFKWPIPTNHNMFLTSFT